MNKNLVDLLKTGEFIGVVEDNKDSEKKQRCKIRIPYLHGEQKDIPTEHLPWAHPNRDNNGISFALPDINKVVKVTFPNGDLMHPVYTNAMHLNINLQKKIESYSGDDYASFIALCYNHNTQIFADNTGLNIAHKEQLIQLHEGGIAMELEDNNSKLALGDSNADQEAMLGTTWMKWMDKLIDALATAYIGNLGANCVPSPDLISVIAQYKGMRRNFLSKHVYIVDNEHIESNKIKTENQIGDNIIINNKPKELDIQKKPLDPVSEEYTLTSTQSTPAQRREEISDHIDEELENNDKYVQIEQPYPEDDNYVEPIKEVNKEIPRDNISVYVTYAAATHSDTAKAHGMANDPTLEHLENMKYVARNGFDPIYEYMLKKYGVKIKVNSFYRNPDVDYEIQKKAVEKGQAKTAKKANSQHCQGMAIDINAGKYNKELFYYIKNNINYDQLLWEFGTDENPNWIHLSMVKSKPRKQAAQMKSGGKFVLFAKSTISRSSPENRDFIT
jgi:zinc D-Ala-D-Ala carboxypeptidase